MWSVITKCLLIGLYYLIIVTTASAEQVFSEVTEPSTYGIATQSAIENIRSSNGTKSFRVVHVDKNLLRGAPGKVILLNLTEDDQHRFKTVGVKVLDGDDFVWKGTAQKGHATITVKDGSAFGSVITPDGKLFWLRPLEGSDHALTEVKRAVTIKRWWAPHENPPLEGAR